MNWPVTAVIAVALLVLAIAISKCRRLQDEREHIEDLEALINATKEPK